MRAYYNDKDPACAQWLRNLIAAGKLPSKLMENWVGKVHQGDCIEIMNKMPVGSEGISGGTMMWAIECRTKPKNVAPHLRDGWVMQGVYSLPATILAAFPPDLLRDLENRSYVFRTRARARKVAKQMANWYCAYRVVPVTVTVTAR